jgi:uncharacterized phage-like protein YoqJ
LVLKKLKPNYTITGMALGVDQIGAEASLALNIPFIAAVPYRRQERTWPKESQEYYFELLKKALKVVLVSKAEAYYDQLMQDRNKWMVDRCHAVLAVWDGVPAGGTYNCIKYAMKLNRGIIQINPKEWYVTTDRGKTKIYTGGPGHGCIKGVSYADAINKEC